MILTVGESRAHIPFPEGIHPVVCVDVMDLGMVTSSFAGVTKTQPKIKIVFEGECTTPEGQRCVISKKLTASLHPKSTLTEILGKWRGRPLATGESIDLEKLIGACATIVVSHMPLRDGTGNYATIDAISKPTKKVIASGEYDRAAAVQRERERVSKYGTEPDDDERATASAAAPRAVNCAAAAAAHPKMSTPPPPPAEAFAGVPAAAAPLSAGPVVAADPESDDVPF